MRRTASASGATTFVPSIAALPSCASASRRRVSTPSPQRPPNASAATSWQQLKLRRPHVLVGRFDRPNLTYRILPRSNLDAQLIETLKRHKDEAAIVYCISRKDTESVAAMLKAAGFKAAAYHAGMDPHARASTQDAFAKERLDVVVATVAFGMGIDRSNVRCVIHAAMPKSIEHYQQETGRAGRDGLEAECVLFRGAGDSRRWELLMTRSAGESGQPEVLTKAQVELVREMEAFASSRTCRHRALSAYFGQEYEKPDCGACDVCLSDQAPMANGTKIARKILECVTALRLPFGAGYVADVLSGAKLEKIRARRHDELPVYGALASMERRRCSNWCCSSWSLDCWTAPAATGRSSR